MLSLEHGAVRWQTVSISGSPEPVWYKMQGKKNVEDLSQQGLAALAEREIWLPDLFALCHDILHEDEIWRKIQLDFLFPQRNPLLISAEESEFRRECSPLQEARFRSVAGETFRRARVWSRSTAKTFPREIGEQLGRVARAIDAHMAPLSIRFPSSIGDEWQKYWDRLSFGGNLLKAVSGRVLPKTARTTRGNSLAQFFSNLVRPDADFDRFVDYGMTAAARVAPVAKFPRIGFIPVVHERHEVSWSKIDNRFFSVRLDPRGEARIVSRVVRALEWLADAGAQIILMPELVSAGSIRHAVEQWLHARGAKKPVLLVVGSELVDEQSSPTGYANRAFVSDSAGSIQWTQDKRNQYRLGPGELAHYDLEGELGSDALDEIGASAEGRITVRDLLGAGRFAVLICEDFARDSPGRRALMTAGVDMCLVLVMDGEHYETGWRQRAAFDIAEEPGASSAVVNSHALLARLRGGSRKVTDLAFYCHPERPTITFHPYDDPQENCVTAYLLEAAPRKP